MRSAVRISSDGLRCTLFPSRLTFYQPARLPARSKHTPAGKKIYRVLAQNKWLVRGCSMRPFRVQDGRILHRNTRHHGSLTCSAHRLRQAGKHDLKVSLAVNHVVIGKSGRALTSISDGDPGHGAHSGTPQRPDRRGKVFTMCAGRWRLVVSGTRYSLGQVCAVPTSRPMNARSDARQLLR